MRGQLCDVALRLARALVELMPAEPEAEGLLALLLLTDARRDARTDDEGAPVLLGEQDRARWDRAMIAEGDALVVRALSRGRPGPYSSRPPSPPATPPPRPAQPPTGARSPPSTPSCCDGSRRRCSRPTGPWRWP